MGELVGKGLQLESAPGKCVLLFGTQPSPYHQKPHIVVPVSLWHATDDVKLGNDTTGLMKE